MREKINGEGLQELEVLSLPNCQFCLLMGLARLAKYDGKTYNGPWADMCETHYQENGIGLGTGIGQKLIVKEQEKHGKHR